MLCVQNGDVKDVEEKIRTITAENVVLRAVKGSLNPSNFLTKAVGGASFAADRAYALGTA